MTLVMIRATESLPLEAVDVELPIYRKHNVTPDEACSTTIIYSQVTVSQDPKFGGFVELSVSEMVDVREVRYEFEFAPYYFGRSERDYDLGLGWYKSSAGEFRDVFVRAQGFLNRERQTRTLQLGWTQVAPTEEGWYWTWRPEHGFGDLDVVHLVFSRGRLCYAAETFERLSPVEPGSWWLHIDKPMPPEVAP